MSDLSQKPIIDINSNASQDNLNKDDLVQELEHLTKIMHDAEKTRTLEEQVAYLKSKGINPSKTYAKWDDDESEYDDLDSSDKSKSE